MLDLPAATSVCAVYEICRRWSRRLPAVCSVPSPHPVDGCADERGERVRHTDVNAVVLRRTVQVHREVLGVHDLILGVPILPVDLQVRAQVGDPPANLSLDGLHLGRGHHATSRSVRNPSTYPPHPPPPPRHLP